uniref:Putative LOC100648174 [Bombus terrestris] n=1 Tax=Lepeophtheirus salmonis TaxID=72036 RepID=A0A0K2THU9_LEPSM
MYETDPVLISFCRGDIIPPIVSSSDSGMLIVFRSSPFGVPDMEPFTSNGFELRVNVLFKNQGSILAAPIKEECRFTIRSGVSPPSGVHDGSLSSGVIENVIHRLVSAKNRSCYYEFQGNSDEVLWITFLMFKVSYDKKKIHRQNSHDCIHRITLQDNEDHSTILTPTNKSLSQTFCESHPPNICDHDYLQFNRHKKKFHFRNCWRHWNESYVSRSSKFTLIETLSLLHSGSTLNFKFRYEFVDVGQGGNAVKRERKVHFINENRNREPLIHRSPILHRDSLSKPEQEPWIHSDHSRVLHSNQHDFIKHNIGKSYEMEVFPSCHRVFNSNASSRKRKKKFFSTKNVFFFGRGSGQKDLQCSYTFQGRPGERILLRINRLNLYNHEICNTIPDPYGNINHFVCSRNSTHGTISEIRISEIPDQKGISLTQFCLCGTGEGNFLSNTSTLRLDLIVSGMTPFTDYSQFLVEGSYEFMHEPVCRLTKIISGQPAGKIEFTDRPDCERQPWVLKPSISNHYLYLRIPGYTMIEPNACSHTHNRIIIHRSSMESLVICPSKLHITEVYSTGWEFEEDFEESSSEEGFSVVIESSVVDRIQIRELSIQWLEIWKPLSLSVGDHKRDSALKIESLVKKNKKKVSLEDETMMHGLMDRGRCDEFCPEINGCISPLLWCDGQVHCPSSGSDESEEHCSHILLPSIYYYGLSSLLGIIAFVFTILLIYKFHIWWVHHRKDSDIHVVSSSSSSSSSRVRRPQYMDEHSLTNISGTIETTLFNHPFIVEGGIAEDGYS